MNLPLGVCLAPEPPSNAARTAAYTGYIHEILAHAGIPYRSIMFENLTEELIGLKILLTLGDARLPASAEAALGRWVGEGGSWISVAGSWGRGDLLGIEVEAPTYAGWGGGIGTLGEGYLGPVGPRHPITSHLQRESRANPGLHFFNGLPARQLSGRALARVRDAHGRTAGRAGIVYRGVGSGRTLFIAPDIPGAVVRIQQGTAVTRDGVPSDDGTAPIADNVLKSGDGGVLDWIFDRQTVPGVVGLQAFLRPAADQWREILVRAVLQMASEAGLSLALLWFYPRNLPGLAHLSHDTDGSDPSLGRGMLNVVNSAGIRSTWCVILPGYPPDLLRAIGAGGHELAMHYDAMTAGCDWSDAEFQRQFQELSVLFGYSPVTNKNHYLRWEGDTEFFNWLVSRGIRLDQSKGAAKTGEAGFNFGACHPYFPIDPAGRFMNVLELPTPLQDLEIFAPAAILPPLLEAVGRVYGILHLLFHPAHIGKDGVEEALSGAFAAARGSGFEWWTAQEISDWERARRSVRWQVEPGGICLLAQDPLPGATVLTLQPISGRWATSRGSGVATPAGAVERWGFTFTASVFDAAAWTQHLVQRTR